MNTAYQTLQVNLAERSYPIWVGNGLLHHWPAMHAKLIGDRRLALVTNTCVGPLYQQQVMDVLGIAEADVWQLPDGEQHKNMQVLDQVFEHLLRRRFGRDAALVALGGGVVGDTVGFAAACYQRGVPFIQIPTTLLAQVDSSVGGKTAVNHALGKNMIGAFHQPLLVLADIATLSTLDDRQLRAGLAEVIKYGLIRDPAFLDWLEQQMPALLARDPQALQQAVFRSCQNKAEVVAEDEFEHGTRALLNLGHTFGHAIETETGYTSWLHGEAIAVGMLMAADMSQRMGMLHGDAVARVQRLLQAAGLPTQPPANMQPAAFMQHMAVDKKVQQGRIRLVLLQALGQAVVRDDYDDADLRACLHACTA